MEGILIYNRELSRPDLALSEGSLLGGLHCGDCLTLWVDGHWQAIRLELDRDWYIIVDGIPCDVPYGQTVRT